MKFIAKVAPLCEAVTGAAKIVNDKTTVPILLNALIVAQDDLVTIRTTDLETTVEYKVPAAVITPGRTTIPAKLLAAYMHELPKDELEFTLQDGIAIMRRGEHSYAEFIVTNPESYPPLPAGTTEHMRDLPGETLAAAITSTALAMTDSPTQNSVTRGGNLVLNTQGIRVVGTDGYRLARYERGEIGAGASVVVPLSGLKAIAHGYAKSPRVTLSTVGPTDNHLLCDDGAIRTWVRLIDQTYPDVSRLMQVTSAIHVRAHRETLHLALKRASLLTDDRAKAVEMRVHDDEIEILVASDSRGSGHEEIPATLEGSNLRIRVNAQFLNEILSAISQPHVHIGLTDSTAPIVIHADEDTPAAQYLLMPLRPE